MAIDKITTGVITDGAVTAVKVAADVATQAELDASGVPGITSTGASSTHLVTLAGNLTVGGSYIKIPSVDTAARNALTPAVGMMIYNSTLGLLQQYNATGWAVIDSPPTVSSLDYPGSSTALDVAGGETLIITGTNFQAGATVTLDGTAPSTVTINSLTQITITGTPAKSAQTFTNGLVVTNLAGLAASIDVDYSGLPAWTTASGNVLTAYITGSAITEIDLAATSATSYAITSGALPTGLSMATSDGDITGTMSGSAATYNFTVTATDAQVQTAARAFNIIISQVATGGDQIRTYQHGGSGTTYRVHIFTTVGAHNLQTFATHSLDIFIIGGGGGGGNGMGGGGGGGGIRFSTVSLSRTLATFPIVVGAGAAAQPTQDQGGHYGIASSFNDGANNATALGGGGGEGEATDPQGVAANWANSGGGIYDQVARYTAGGGTDFTGYTRKSGNEGGTGGGASGNYPSGGGGAPGTNAVSLTAADQRGPGADGWVVSWVTPRLFGQAGTHNSIGIDTGYHWGGGGGGSAASGAAGAGSGGKGGGGGGAVYSTGPVGAFGNYGWNTGAAGVNDAAGGAGGAGGANTGAGGGGGTDSAGPGGAGGSGIVIVRYAI